MPVGVFLSGGIDSSTNAQLFSEGEGVAGQDVQHRLRRRIQELPERAALRAHGRRLVGAEHHERLLTQHDLLDFLPTMVQLQDEPIGDPVCVPVYYVSDLARRNGVTVCQVGEGADELFCGYPTWKTKLRLQQMDDAPVPRAFKRLAMAGLRLAGKDLGHPYEALRRLARDSRCSGAAPTPSPTRRNSGLLTGRLQQQFTGVTSWDALAPIWQRFQEKAWEPSHLHWMTYVDLNLRLPELLLMRVDKMSMGVSLEGRVPFLDHKFVELALGIPSALKTKNGKLKYILKKAVRGVIPDEIIDRKKQGFGVPVYEWCFGALGERVSKELDEFCGETDFIDRRAVTASGRAEAGTAAVVPAEPGALVEGVRGTDPRRRRRGRRGPGPAGVTPLDPRPRRALLRLRRHRDVERAHVGSAALPQGTEAARAGEAGLRDRAE